MHKSNIYKAFRIQKIILAILFLSLTACNDKSGNNRSSGNIELNKSDSTIVSETTADELEQQLIKHGLVNIADAIPGILVELRYSTINNFMGKDMYGELTHAYLQPDVVEKLAKAQILLTNENPNLVLLVYDGVRPLHIQQMMWDSLDVPLAEKRNFLSDPALGSLHNYGAAVDITIANQNGEALDMGTPYDYIGELAYPSLEKELLSLGKLTTEQVSNRILLRKVMLNAGFTGIETEWWHFNACTRELAKAKYRIVE